MEIARGTAFAAHDVVVMIAEHHDVIEAEDIELTIARSNAEWIVTRSSVGGQDRDTRTIEYAPTRAHARSFALFYIVMHTGTKVD